MEQEIIRGTTLLSVVSIRMFSSIKGGKRSKAQRNTSIFLVFIAVITNDCNACLVEGRWRITAVLCEGGEMNLLILL